MTKKIKSLHEAHEAIAQELELIQRSMAQIRKISHSWEVSVVVDLGDNESHYVGCEWDSSDCTWESSDYNY